MSSILQSIIKIISGILITILTNILTKELSWQNKRRFKLIIYEILSVISVGCFLTTPVFFVDLYDTLLNNEQFKKTSAIMSFSKYSSIFLIIVLITSITVLSISLTFSFLYETTKGDLYYYYYLDGSKKNALQYSDLFIDKFDKEKLRKITIIDPNLIYWGYKHGKLFNVFDKWFKFLSKHTAQLFLIFFSVSYLLTSLYIKLIFYLFKYSSELYMYLSRYKEIKAFILVNKYMPIICVIILIIIPLYNHIKKINGWKQRILFIIKVILFVLSICVGIILSFVILDLYVRFTSIFG